MTRNTEEELARMQEVNLTLRRQLERARRDVLLYAAQFCEDNNLGFAPSDHSWELIPVGPLYAAKLREIAG